jgi:hypothetical protein
MLASVSSVPGDQTLKIILFAALCPFLLGAQQLSISGTVRDAHGVVADASATLRSPAGTRSLDKTDSTGQYHFDRLVAGPYELSIAREGFEPVTRTLSLTAESRVVDIALSVGGIATSVDVTDVAGKTTGSRMQVPDR